MRTDAEMYALDQWQDLLTGTEPYPLPEVLLAVNDAMWQRLRIAMKGLTLEMRHKMMQLYLEEQKGSRAAKVRVRNYIGALQRGGMIEPRAAFLERQRNADALAWHLLHPEPPSQS